MDFDHKSVNEIKGYSYISHLFNGRRELRFYIGEHRVIDRGHPQRVAKHRISTNNIRAHTQGVTNNMETAWFGVS